MSQTCFAQKKSRRALAAALLAALLFTFAACGGPPQTGNRVLAEVGSQELAMAFRAGDPVGVLVPAALQELAAEGTVAATAVRWFGSDPTEFSPEQGAVAAALESLGLDAPPQRTFILGVDAGAIPFAFSRDEGYTGFDVELAQAVCGKLGWEFQVQPISPLDVETELASGNIDCAWGGLSFPNGSTQAMTVSAPYLEDKLVVVVRADSGITRLGKLSGKLITLRDSVTPINSFENNAALGKLNLQKRYLPSLAACFEALGKGECDAVFLSGLAANYILSGQAAGQ